MKIKYLAFASVLLAGSLQSCKEDVAQTTENNMADTSKNDTLMSTPMAHAMDSAYVVPKVAVEKPGFITLDKGAVTLNSVTDGNTDKAYLVFNEDQTKAEVFLPNMKIGTILERKGEEGNYSWTDGTYELIGWKGYVFRTLKGQNNLFAGDVK